MDGARTTYYMCSTGGALGGPFVRRVADTTTMSLLERALGATTRQ